MEKLLKNTHAPIYAPLLMISMLAFVPGDTRASSGGLFAQTPAAQVQSQLHGASLKAAISKRTAVPAVSAHEKKMMAEMPGTAVQMQKQLAAILASSNSQIILWGESNHCDVKQVLFLAHPGTVRLLAQAGVKRVFLEYPPVYQQAFDKAAAGKRTTVMIHDFASSGCPGSDDRKGDEATAFFIHNVAQLGIQVYAADMNNSTDEQEDALGKAEEQLNYRFLEADAEKDPVKKHAIKAAAVREFDAFRMADGPVAAFVKEHSAQGRSVIYRGEKHFSLMQAQSLRVAFPGALLLSYTFKSAAGSLQQKACSTGQSVTDEYEEKLLPPDYSLDLKSGEVQKCAR